MLKAGHSAIWLPLSLALACVAESYLLRSARSADAFLLFAFAGAALALATWTALASSAPSPVDEEQRKYDPTEVSAGLMILVLAIGGGASIGRASTFGDGLAFYGLAALLLVLVWWRQASRNGFFRRTLTGLRSRPHEVLLVSALFLGGALFRIYRMNVFPPPWSIMGDESEMGMRAARISSIKN